MRINVPKNNTRKYLTQRGQLTAKMVLFAWFIFLSIATYNSVFFNHIYHETSYFLNMLLMDPSKKISIDIKHEDYRKLEYNRKIALSQGILYYSHFTGPLNPFS